MVLVGYWFTHSCDTFVYYNRGVNPHVLLVEVVINVQKAFRHSETMSQGCKWIHRKTGGIYSIICVTNLEATSQHFEAQVVYEDDEMRIWSRPLSEWNDKFSFIR